VSCVECCFREGTCNRAFLVQVREAAGSNLLLRAREEQQIFTLYFLLLDQEKIALGCQLSPGM